LLDQLARPACLLRIVRDDQSDDHIGVDTEHLTTASVSSSVVHRTYDGRK
jgi:hypothetical protein